MKCSEQIIILTQIDNYYQILSFTINIKQILIIIKFQIDDFGDPFIIQDEFIKINLLFNKCKIFFFIFHFIWLNDFFWSSKSFNRSKSSVSLGSARVLVVVLTWRFFCLTRVGDTKKVKSNVYQPSINIRYTLWIAGNPLKATIKGKMIMYEVKISMLII